MKRKLFEKKSIKTLKSLRKNLEQKYEGVLKKIRKDLQKKVLIEKDISRINEIIIIKKREECQI